MRALRLVAQNPNIDITVQMGDGAATPTAGLAGWETVARPGRKGLTDFTGTEPFEQSVPILLDGFRKGNSIERHLQELLRLGGDTVFRAYGPIDRSGIRYVFGGEPEFGEVIKDDDGDRLRQRVTLKLREYVRPDTIERSRRGRKRMGVGSNQPLTHITKAGETLQEIAAESLGDWRRWPEIGRKNDISDPNRKLPAGRELRL